MPTSNNTVSKYGTEKEFIIELVTSIMSNSDIASNHSLVCKISDIDDFANAETISSVSDVATKVNDNFSGTTINIWFIIDNCVILLIARDAQNKAYNFATFFNNVFGSSIRLSFRPGNSLDKDTISTRVYKYQVISNANVLFIVFGGISEHFPLVTDTCQSAFIYKNNNEFACGSNVAATLRSTDMQELKAVDRLEYINNATNPTAIETIHNKVIVTSAGKNKVITMDNIWDSTYSPALMFEVNVTENNQNVSAVYLNNYTVMPI